MNINFFVFDDFYFNNPWWIASHNFLHSPTLLLIFLALLWPFRARSGTRRYWLFWFFAGCLLHTALDIPTHVRDGPVIFFPFDWHYRFQSTISYWDPRYFGREFTVFEIGLNIVLLLYLLVPWFWGRLQQRRGGSPTPEQPT
ncbi:MAG: metal-dependent hydrolase [Chloroflexaceae bacterium]|nr:metal-dependent hydrolase [Chloroflexaceae bacterium]